ncbi:MAG: peptidylprolyl isomerase [Candidatus Dormibacteria bacterium]
MRDPQASRRRGRVARVVARLLPLLALAGCGSAPSATPAATPVAVVGAVSISRQVFDLRLTSALSLIGRSGGGAASGKARDAMVGELRASVMRGLIIDAVIIGEARYHRLEASDGDVEASLAADRRAAGGDEALRQQLGEAGGSLDQLRDETRSRLNEQRLEDYFARARADDAERELIAGTDFPAVATQYSDDEATRARGGDAGTFTEDQLKGGDPAFGQAVLSLAAGQSSAKPIRDRAGYDIVRVDAISPAGRALHRILVAAPDPYTVRSRPGWFTASVVAAINDDCGRGQIHLLIKDAGPSPCVAARGSPSSETPRASSTSASPRP